MDDGFVGGADWEHQMREAGAAITKRVTGVRARLSAANQALLAGTRVRLAVNEQLAGTNQLRPRAETEAAVRAALEKAQDLAVLATRARMSAEDVAATATRMRLLAEDIAELRPSAEKLAEIARVAEKEAEEAQLAEVVHLVHLEQLEFELVERTGRLVEVKREEGEAKKTEPRLVFTSLNNVTYSALLILFAVLTAWVGGRVLWGRDPVLFLSACASLGVVLLYSMFTLNDTVLAYTIPVYFVGTLAAGFSNAAAGSDHAKVVALFLATAGSFMMHRGWQTLAEEYKQSFFEQGYDSASLAERAAAKAQKVPIGCEQKSMAAMMTSEAYRTYTGRCVAVARDASLKPEKGALGKLQMLYHPDRCKKAGLAECDAVCTGTFEALMTKSCEAK